MKYLKLKIQGSYPVGQSKTLELPLGATSCRINVENLVFIG